MATFLLPTYAVLGETWRQSAMENLLRIVCIVHCEIDHWLSNGQGGDRARGEAGYEPDAYFMNSL
jgi:hypothetical protein